MKIKFIVIGTKMPQWVNAGYQEYQKRFPPECSFQLVELPIAKRGKSSDIQRLKTKEGEALLAATKGSDLIIALDVLGKPLSTERLVDHCKEWRSQGTSVSLLVGGPDGLSSACLQAAHQRWSLSALTLPHPLVRVMVVEQFYRAWSILQNHPYHR